MTDFVALVRGINVGGNKTIRMGRLKALLETCGLSSVQTVLQSGNVIFSSSETSVVGLQLAIETAIEVEFGFRAAVILRTAAQFEKIVSGNPFPAMAKDAPGRLVVMFLSRAPDADAAEDLAAQLPGPEEVRLAGDVAYITYPNGIGRSKLTNALLEKRLGVLATARNWNTVTKLLLLTRAR